MRLLWAQRIGLLSSTRSVSINGIPYDPLVPDRNVFFNAEQGVIPE